MSAKVVELSERLISRAERRRAETLASIARSLNALRMTAEHSIPTMGDRDAELALRALSERLDHEQARALTLADEFKELHEAVAENGDE